MNNDPVLGLHGNALLLREKRAAVLASNLVNASTPGFQARDFDFQKVLSQFDHSKQMSMAQTSGGHMAQSMDPLAYDLQYRVTNKTSADGNTVDSDIEQAQFAENAMRYQATLTFIQGRVRSLMSAIRGE